LSKRTSKAKALQPILNNSGVTKAQSKDVNNTTLTAQSWALWKQLYHYVLLICLLAAGGKVDLA